MWKQKILFILVVFMQGCGGISDSVDDLSGGYQHVYESNLYATIENGNSTDPEILCTVVDYEWNESYIIAKQVYHSDCLGKVKNIYKQKEGVMYYWIINTITKKSYGPFLHKQDFLLQKKKLKIDLTL